MNLEDSESDGETDVYSFNGCSTQGSNNFEKDSLSTNQDSYASAGQPSLFTRLLRGGYSKGFKVTRSRERDTSPSGAYGRLHELQDGLQTTSLELKKRNNKAKNMVLLDDRSAQGPRKDSKRQTECLEYEIQKHDTLQSLALRCSCTVSELKTINNLINDQDFYGLQFIKIPIKRYGILSEVFVQQMNSTTTATATNLTRSIHYGDSHLPSPSTSTADSGLGHRKDSEPLVVNIGLRRTFELDSNTKDMTQFLKNLDEDLAKIRQSNARYDNEDVLFDQRSSSPIVSTVVSPPKSNLFYSCDGDTCGLTWVNVVILAAFVCILVPIIYIIIFEENESFKNETR